MVANNTTKMLTLAERKAIRARLTAASPGPWVHGGPLNRDQIIAGAVRALEETGFDGHSMPERYFEIGPDDDRAVPPAFACAGREGDAAFISHAREDVARLLDALDQAEEVLRAHQRQP